VRRPTNRSSLGTVIRGKFATNMSCFSVCMCVSMFVCSASLLLVSCVCICMYVCMYVCTHVCMYVCKHIQIHFVPHTHTYIHTYIHTTCTQEAHRKTNLRWGLRIQTNYCSTLQAFVAGLMRSYVPIARVSHCEWYVCTYVCMYVCTCICMYEYISI
jgi:hypothetical protein